MSALDDAGQPLLSVRNLRTHFHGRHATVRAVDGVSFDLRARETIAIVGESGSGKSVTAFSIMGLLPRGNRTTDGEVVFAGRELLGLDESSMRRIRGNEIAMIFQEPMTSLNPVLRIGRQVGEGLRRHQGFRRTAASDRAVELLAQVQLSEPSRRADQYPHELSGGMRQRVMIAMALACKPKVLIADEPTTALDVTVQAQILDLMREQQRQSGAAILLITHDLGVVAEMAQRVIVMYAGRMVEESPVSSLFERPLHPYTKGLLESMPKLGSSLSDGPRRLREIPGTIPLLDRVPSGCAFAPRCPLATQRCHREAPSMEEHRPDRWSACWEWEKAEAA